MKRQRGRNRGGGGGKPQHNANRSFESNGPDVKVRGNAQTVFEKYQQLARDAGSAGDRVLAENYLQHAEHYFRVLRAMQPQRTPSDIMVRDQFSSGLDIDFEAEPDENDQSNDTESSDDNNNDSQQGERRDNRQRDDRPRDDRQRDDRQQGQQRDDRQQGDRQQGEGGGNGRGRRDRWRERDDRQGRFERGAEQPREQQRDPMAVVEPRAQSLPAGEKPEASPVLRSASGDVSHAPAFLGAPRGDAEEAPPKPRRTRKPKAPANEDA